MRKLLMALASTALVAVGGAGAAQAQVFSPQPAAGWGIASGSFNLQQTVSTSCTVTAGNVDTTSLTTGVIAGFSFNSGCLATASGTWNLKLLSTYRIEVSNVTVASSLGTCSGSFEADWDNATQTLTVPAGTSVPGLIFGFIPTTCYLDGAVRLAPNRTNSLPLYVL